MGKVLTVRAVSGPGFKHWGVLGHAWGAQGGGWAAACAGRVQANSGHVCSLAVERRSDRLLAPGWIFARARGQVEPPGA